MYVDKNYFQRTEQKYSFKRLYSRESKRESKQKSLRSVSKTEYGFKNHEITNLRDVESSQKYSPPLLSSSPGWYNRKTSIRSLYIFCLGHVILIILVAASEQAMYISR